MDKDQEIEELLIELNDDKTVPFEYRQRYFKILGDYCKSAMNNAFEKAAKVADSQVNPDDEHDPELNCVWRTAKDIARDIRKLKIQDPS